MIPGTTSTCELRVNMMVFADHGLEPKLALKVALNFLVVDVIQ